LRPVRDVGHLAAFVGSLFEMLEVVQANAIKRAWYHGQFDLHVLQRMGACRALPLAERIAADSGDLVALDDAPGGLPRGGEFQPTHFVSSLRGSARLALPGTGSGSRQSEIFPQGLAGIILLKETAALQFGHDVADEV